jgi:hypothetical protein
MAGTEIKPGVVCSASDENFESVMFAYFHDLNTVKCFLHLCFLGTRL